MKLNKILILAGGFGTRIKNVAANIPKSMIKIGDKPIIEHQIKLCKFFGFTDIVISTYFLSDIISEYLGDGTNLGVNLTYLKEEEPRGTAGALLDALPYLDENFILIYGDVFLDVDLSRIFDWHIKANSEVTIFLHPNNHPHDSDIVEVNENLRVLEIHPYPHENNSYYRNLVNAGLYVMNRKKIMPFLPILGKHDIAKNVFPHMIKQQINFYGYISQEYIKDMGTPDRLVKVRKDFELNIPNKLSIRKLRSAIFLDRDGTINYDFNRVKSPEQIKLIPFSGEAIKKINENGYLAICVTNQPVVARGEVSFKQLNDIHAYLDYLIGLEGAYLDKIYACPHHPDKGFTGELIELKFECDCRKPRTGLIDKACRELLITRDTSWIIGDSSSDIEAGKIAGLKTILIRTGNAGQDKKYKVQPDYIMPDLNSSVDWILNDYKIVFDKLLPITLESLNQRLILIGGVSRSGKSTAAQVMKEQFLKFGKTAHIINIDGWLKPKFERKEESGVLLRYNVENLMSSIVPIISSTSTEYLNCPIYDRKLNNSDSFCGYLISSNDTLIVEGVIVLLLKELYSLSKRRIYIESTPSKVSNRFYIDYLWRGLSREEINKIYISRQKDEFNAIKNSIKIANYVIRDDV